jgi:hypothetical protein
MTMTFFFNVTDTGESEEEFQSNPIHFAHSCSVKDFYLFFGKGSWLQIGQSISHFCITSLLLVFSAGIASVGETLMRGSVTVVPRHYHHHPKKVDSETTSAGGNVDK